MKAVCWEGTDKITVERCAGAAILNPRDAIVRVTSTAICGSDLHLMDGFIPTMKAGDILGHEFMGEVVDIGRSVSNLRKGDQGDRPVSDRLRPLLLLPERAVGRAATIPIRTRAISEKLYGYPAGALFGYSHMMGGYAGGQAEFVRVPYADVGPFKVPDHLSDEQVLFLTDIFPTGYMAAENCNIRPWRHDCGVGLRAGRAVRHPQRISPGRLAGDRDRRGARTTADGCRGGRRDARFDGRRLFDRLKTMTGGLGPDACIDAVGMEAHGAHIDYWYDKAKTRPALATDRATAVRQAIHCCRKGGIVSIPGVYGGFIDKVPMGAAFSKGLTLKMGQTHVHRYLSRLLRHIENGDIDPSFVVTHREPLEQAPTNVPDVPGQAGRLRESRAEASLSLEIRRAERWTFAFFTFIIGGHAPARRCASTPRRCSGWL